MALQQDVFVAARLSRHKCICGRKFTIYEARAGLHGDCLQLWPLAGTIIEPITCQINSPEAVISSPPILLTCCDIELGRMSDIEPGG